MDDQEKREVGRWKKRREDMFLRRLFGMFAKMAKSDGRIDAWEAHAAEKAFSRFPRAAARRRFCINVFNTAGTSSISLMKMAWDFSTSCAERGECLVAYEILWDIACAKGLLKPVQMNYLRSLCRYLNLPAGTFESHYREKRGMCREWTAEDEQREQAEAWKAKFAQEAEVRRKAEACRREEARRRAEAEAREHARWKDYQKRMYDWYAGRNRTSEQSPSPKSVSPLQAEYDLLGCSPDASDAIVRSAYRTEAKKCHPDILRARGCSETVIVEATEKMSKINAAWEKVRAARGI